ncbi:MAG: HD domain-containing protein [Thermodesulfobacteriota bacterium]
MIPTVSQCLALMEQYAMLPNIREHSLMVGRVACLIGEELREAGYELSMELLVSGALLHDIAKTECLGKDVRHDQRGREICLAHGFDELAAIVAEHVILRNGVPERCTEKEIVFYADKRVLHDEVVELESRLAYIIERYGQDDQALHARIHENFRQARAIEQHLFTPLPFSPDQVATLLPGRCQALRL